MASSTKLPPNLKAKLKCPFCFKIFDDGPALIKHLALHNLVERKESEIKNISSEASLPQCYVRVARCDNLVQCSVKPEISTNPGISGDRKVRLETPLNYVKIRSSKGEVLFRCTKCPKTYRHRTSVRVHFRTHTGAKRHRCTLCDRAFTRLDKLKEHARVHTGDNE